MSDTVTLTKDKNRRVRQEALREQLSKQGHLQHVVDNLKKIEDIGKDGQELDSLQIQRLRIANETRLKLLNKYLPDLKQVEAEVSGDMGLTIKVMNYAKSESSE